MEPYELTDEEMTRALASVPVYADGEGDRAIAKAQCKKLLEHIRDRGFWLSSPIPHGSELRLDGDYWEALLKAHGIEIP